MMERGQVYGENNTLFLIFKGASFIFCPLAGFVNLQQKQRSIFGL